MTLPKHIGHFDITDKLGYGGMGTVYLAHDPRLNRDVAIKVMHEHLGLHDQFRVRFAREAQAIAALDHPHIIKIFYADADQGRPYLVMEYFPNGSLRDYLNDGYEQNKLLSVHEIVQMVIQIASALDFAHQQNMVHRDVKPDNVLLKAPREVDNTNSEFSAVLSDFGLVKIMEGSDLPTQSIPQGTFPYMAPEQFTGSKTDHRTDIYALGMMFYELLTGELPFRSRSLMEIAKMHIEEQPTPLRNVRPNIPPELEHVVLKCIAKRPDQRFQSCKDLTKALRPLQEEKAVNASLDEMDTVIDSMGRLDRLITYLAPPTTVEPSPVPFNLGAGLSTNIGISSSHLVLNAGESDEMRVAVQNRNSTTENYRLIVTDISPEWVTVDKPQISLPAGRNGEFTILIHPPRRSWSRAGHHRINFQIINREDVVIGEASGMITIHPFHDMAAELRPDTIRNADDVDVVIHNRGNTRQLVNVTAHDNDAALTFSPAATKIPLDPGGQQKVKIHVGMRHDSDLQSKPRIPFTITVKPFEGEIKILSGKVINTSMASNGESHSMGRSSTRRLHIFAELTWGILSLLLFGWLFMIFDIILTSPQLLDRPNTVHPSWAMTLPENDILIIVPLLMTIGIMSGVVGFFKQKLNILQRAKMSFWVDAGFAALFPIAFIILFFIAVEVLSSGLSWAGDDGAGTTPAAIVLALSTALVLMVSLKLIVTSRIPTN